MATTIVSHNGVSYELRAVSSGKVVPGKLTPIGFVPVPVLKGEMFDASVADVLNGIGLDVELMFGKAVDGLAVYMQDKARKAVESKDSSQLAVMMAAATMSDADLNGVKRGSPEHLAMARKHLEDSKSIEAPSATKIWWELLPKLLGE